MHASLPRLLWGTLFLATLGCHRTEPAEEPKVTPRPSPSAHAEYQSPEKRLVADAIERARANGRKVLVDISAWLCGPCQVAAHDFEENANSILDEINKNFEFVTVEISFLPLESMHDFLPVSAGPVPAFVFLDPDTGAMTQASGYDSTESLKAMMNHYLEKGPFVGEVAKQIEDHLRAGQQIPPLYVSPVVNTLPWEKGGPALLGFWKTLTEAQERSASVFSDPSYSIEFAMYDVARYLVTLGTRTLQALRSELPDVADYAGINLLSFEVERIVRTSGYAAAAAACPKLEAELPNWFPLKLKVPPPDASAAEVEKINRDNEYRSQGRKNNLAHNILTCALLKALSGTLTESEAESAVAQAMAQGNPEDPPYELASKVLAYSGANPSKAIQYIQATTDRERKSRNESLQLKRELLAEALQGSDPAAIAKAEYSVKAGKFALEALEKYGGMRIDAIRRGVPHPLMTSSAEPQAR